MPENRSVVSILPASVARGGRRYQLEGGFGASRGFAGLLGVAMRRARPAEGDGSGEEASGTTSTRLAIVAGGLAVAGLFGVQLGELMR